MLVVEVEPEVKLATRALVIAPFDWEGIVETNGSECRNNQADAHADIGV